MDYLHHQVLRHHSSIKSIIKSELKREITSKLSGHSQSVCLLYINEIVSRITFEMPTEKNTHQIFAVISGSFPTWLADCVKEYKDIDVFLVINTSDKKHLKLVFPVLYMLEEMYSKVNI